PARPQIFHGRDSELQDVVDSLMIGQARIAILGPGGVGKTALALAAMHHPRVSAAYEHIYFISCQSCSTCSDLIAKVASYLGLGEKGSPKSVLQHLSYQPTPVLFLFDNLETTWENNHRRAEVEEFLSRLTEVPKLSLMITMRGAERPAKVQWSRPFIPPLAPFDGSAALQTFHEIAGDNEDPAIIQELLQLTGNLPLAVSLLANIAASDGCELALSRWATERTQLLSDGYDQTSSLDISITLSYTSPRMTPGAQELLSLLSILPDGISDADLVHSGINIPNILSCKATLIQTSLAYVDHHRFLQVLPPIREHIRRTYPVKAALTASLRQHFHAIIAL
ncbi:P-loop containing nucleoside triphosphate hydrolase protein, partial [Mycena alexandri]